MKLSVTNPEVVDTLVDSPGGLWPTRRGGDSRMILIVKAQREMARTAKLRGGFRFYLVPVYAGDVATHGLLTAFFDDKDEPLTIRTPLFNEEITRDFLLLLSSNYFYVHFLTSTIENCLASEPRTLLLLASVYSRIHYSSCPHPLRMRASFTTTCNSGSAPDYRRMTTLRSLSICGNGSFRTAWKNTSTTRRSQRA